LLRQLEQRELLRCQADTGLHTRKRYRSSRWVTATW